MARPLFYALLLCSLLLAGSCGKPETRPGSSFLEVRPSPPAHVYDRAGILVSSRDYAETQLRSLRAAFGIEAVVVTLPSLPRGITVEQATLKILNNWKIGKETDGRGIVLLLAEQEKAVRMEVSYGLEDVFTDLFCGYIQDLQMKPHFLAGQAGIGLLAVTEELAGRASIKYKGGYTRESIAALDRRNLSGGAGARVDLGALEKEKVRGTGRRFPPGRTPAEAWETMVGSWREKVRDPYLGVYTRVGQLIYRDFLNIPDARFDENIRLYGAKPFQIRTLGSYAAVFFGMGPEWENAPFLLARTGEGWRFDLVNQRRYVRSGTGTSPRWGIEWSDHPYMTILSDCPGFDGQDIPLPPEDRYRVEEDARMADEILAAEEEVRRRPGTPEPLVALGRLYAICAMGARSIPVLEQAKALGSKDPRLHWYLAVAHVDAFYQYEKAGKELEEYIGKAPKDPFGHSFLGYLAMRLSRYPDALSSFGRAMSLNPKDPYPPAKVAEIYLRLAGKERVGTEQYREFKGLALKYLARAEAIPSRDRGRTDRLREAFARKGLIAKEGKSRVTVRGIPSPP